MQKKEIVSNIVGHNLSKQTKSAINALDCLFSVILCKIHDIEIKKSNIQNSVIETVSKAHKLRQELLSNKIKGEYNISPINYSTAMNISVLFNNLIESAEYATYVASSIDTSIPLATFKFIQESISTTRLCLNIAGNLISGSTDLFTEYKVNKINLMCQNVKKSYPKIKSYFSEAISDIQGQKISTSKINEFYALHVTVSKVLSCFNFAFCIAEIAGSLVKNL